MGDEETNNTGPDLESTNEPSLPNSTEPSMDKPTEPAKPSDGKKKKSKFEQLKAMMPDQGKLHEEKKKKEKPKSGNPHVQALEAGEQQFEQAANAIRILMRNPTIKNAVKDVCVEAWLDFIGTGPVVKTPSAQQAMNQLNDAVTDRIDEREREREMYAKRESFDDFDDGIEMTGIAIKPEPHLTDWENEGGDLNNEDDDKAGEDFMTLVTSSHPKPTDSPHQADTHSEAEKEQSKAQNQEDQDKEPMDVDDPLGGKRLN